MKPTKSPQRPPATKPISLPLPVSHSRRIPSDSFSFSFSVMSAAYIRRFLSCQNSSGVIDAVRKYLFVFGKWPEEGRCHRSENFWRATLIFGLAYNLGFLVPCLFIGIGPFVFRCNRPERRVVDLDSVDHLVRFINPNLPQKISLLLNAHFLNLFQ